MKTIKNSLFLAIILTGAVQSSNILAANAARRISSALKYYVGLSAVTGAVDYAMAQPELNNPKWSKQYSFSQIQKANPNKDIAAYMIIQAIRNGINFGTRIIPGTSLEEIAIADESIKKPPYLGLLLQEPKVPSLKDFASKYIQNPNTPCDKIDVKRMTTNAYNYYYRRPSDTKEHPINVLIAALRKKDKLEKALTCISPTTNTFVIKGQLEHIKEFINCVEMERPFDYVVIENCNPTAKDLRLMVQHIPLDQLRPVRDYLNRLISYYKTPQREKFEQLLTKRINAEDPSRTRRLLRYVGFSK